MVVSLPFVQVCHIGYSAVTRPQKQQTGKLYSEQRVFNGEQTGKGLALSFLVYRLLVYLDDRVYFPKALIIQENESQTLQLFRCAHGI